MFVCTSWCTFLCLQYKLLELELQDQKWMLYEWVCVMTVHPERLYQGLLLPALWKRTACFAVASPTLYNSCFQGLFFFFDQRVKMAYQRRLQLFFVSFLWLCVSFVPISCQRAFQVAKNIPASAGDARDMGSIPGSGRALGVGNGNPL